MSWRAIAIRGALALAFAFWSVQVLAVAVFAVADRYSGAQAVFMSLVVLVGGFAPVAFLVYLFRDYLRPSHPAPPTASAQPVQPNSQSGIEHHSQPPVEALSDRELEVLSLIARGLSNKEIAAHLSVTVGTVKTHTNNINRKLGSRTRTQALARAREHNLL